MLHFTVLFATGQLIWMTHACANVILDLFAIEQPSINKKTLPNEPDQKFNRSDWHYDVGIKNPSNSCLLIFPPHDIWSIILGLGVEWQSMDQAAPILFVIQTAPTPSSPLILFPVRTPTPQMENIPNYPGILGPTVFYTAWDLGVIIRLAVGLLNVIQYVNLFWAK